MLLTAKYFFFFEKNDWSLPLKNFNFLTQKLKPVKQWKVAYVTRVNCQYLAGILSYLVDSCFRIILKRIKGMLLPAKSFCFFVINDPSLPTKNFNFLT